MLNEKFESSLLNLSKIKKTITPIAEKYNIRSVYVFGSYARNQANADSDVDILIDREGSEIHGIFGMSALFNDLKDALGKEIDLVTLQSLSQASTIKNNPAFIENVMRERIKIYG